MAKKITVLLSLFFIVLTVSAIAADKTWGSGGDETSWSDQYNWYPAEVPTISDDVLIDIEDGSITVDQTFTAKSITIGGGESTTVTTESFVFGDVEPDAVTDSAIINRYGGKLTLSGVGVITLKGTYESMKDASASISEPSFMLWVE